MPHVLLSVSTSVFLKAQFFFWSGGFEKLLELLLIYAFKPFSVVCHEFFSPPAWAGLHRALSLCEWIQSSHLTRQESE